MTTLKDRPQTVYDNNELMTNPEMYEWLEWFEDFEEEFPIKLNVLAELLSKWLNDTQGYMVSPSLLAIRSLLQGWYEKEILGEKENEA